MTRLTMTRRSFIKAAAVTCAAATLLSTQAPFQALADDSVRPVHQDTDGVKRIRTGCRACGKMECGSIAIVENGRVIRVEGDEMAFQSRGNCCTKSQSSMQAAYHPDRLHYPLRRTNAEKSDTADGQFERITWDEAWAEVGTKLKEVEDKYGGEAIFTMGGTSRVWSQGPYGTVATCFNTPNKHLAYAICKGPRHFTGLLTDDLASPWYEAHQEPKVYIQWGTAVEYSNYDDSARTIVDVALHADTHILVDPRMGALGKEADIWLPIRIGTDSFMACTWLNYVLVNELYDDAFVRRWTNGPFLVVDEANMEPSGGWAMTGNGGIWTNTQLLKESDIQDGGQYDRYMCYDEANEELFYFDKQTMQWEGETHVVPTSGINIEAPYGKEGIAWLPDASNFGDDGSTGSKNQVRVPQLFGEVQVTLKDGTSVTAKPVWDLFCEFASEWTLEKGSEYTEVPADKIEEAIIAWTTRIDDRYGNGGFHIQLAPDQIGDCIQCERALQIMACITGNSDFPGGNRGPTRAPIDANIGRATMMPAAATEPLLENTNFISNANIIGGETFPLLRYWKRWCDATELWEALLTEEPYPIKAGLQQSGDFMNHANTSIARQGMQAVEFFVSIDLWRNPTNEYADILMPCLHWLELDATRVSQGASGAYGCTVKVIEGPGECWHDAEFNVKLWEVMGRQWKPDDTYPDLNELLDWCWGDAGTEEVAYGGTWDEAVAEFQENSWWDSKSAQPERWGTYRRWETGGLRQKGAYTMFDSDWLPGFQTATGKVEIWSTILEAYSNQKGDYFPIPAEPLEAKRNTPELYEADNVLFMTTGARTPTYFHNEHRQLPWCRELWPVPRLELHPETAAEFGIEQGEWLWVETEHGKVRLIADLYYGVKRDECNANHAWWYPELPAPLRGVDLSLINNVMNPHSRDHIISSSNLRGLPVRVYKATAENCDDGNIIPTASDGTEIISSPDDERLKAWLPTYEGRD